MIYQKIEETVSIVLIAYEEAKTAKICLKTIKQIYPGVHVVVVDNGSTDGLSDWLSEQGYEFIYFDEGKQNYGKVINTVVEHMQLREKVFFMEPRYILVPQVLERLADIMDNHAEVGMVSPNFHNRLLERENNGELPSYEEVEETAAKSENQSYYYLLKLFWRTFMMKKEQLIQNGMFDERLEESGNALVDYILRLIQIDVKPAVCESAYVFDVMQGHSDEEFSKNDREVLVQKWGMNYFNVKYNPQLINLIKHESQDTFLVLEVGCDLGSTLLEIKNRFPNSQGYGLEISKLSVSVAKHIANVSVGDIEEKNIPFSEKFDYIIFGDVLEHLHDPKEVLKYCREILKDDGCIIASIPNLMHISVMEQLIEGRFTYQDMGLLDKTHIHFFTYYELLDMLQSTGYELEDLGSIVKEPTEKQKQLKQVLCGLSQETQELMYDAYQYLIRAVKK